MEAPRALILDFLEWVSARPRTYREVMECWRTSCPRLPIWEDSVDHGLVVRRRSDSEAFVELTDAGTTLLRTERDVSRA